jgi:hypothetical protein
MSRPSGRPPVGLRTEVDRMPTAATDLDETLTA